jgi:hypothetical protein
MSEARTRVRLDAPREVRRRRIVPWTTYDADTFGVFAERFARFMGTAKFLIYMTLFVIVWVTANLVGLFGLHWDPYPFILLNLFFSTQASYAAPLILLAQNRQEDRDRVMHVAQVCLDGGLPQYEIEHRMVHKNGGIDTHDVVIEAGHGFPPKPLEVVFELYPIGAKVVHGLQTVINLGRRVNKPIFFGMAYDIFK